MNGLGIEGSAGHFHSRIKMEIFHILDSDSEVPNAITALIFNIP